MGMASLSPTLDCSIRTREGISVNRAFRRVAAEMLDAAAAGRRLDGADLRRSDGSPPLVALTAS